MHRTPTSSSFTLHILPLCLCALLLTLLKFDAITVLSSEILGGATGDGGLYVWLSQIIFTPLSPHEWFQAPFFYPYGYTLAWSDNYILPSLIVALLKTLGTTPLLSYNIVLLASSYLLLFTSYLCAFLFTNERWSSAWAASAYTSLCYFSVHLGHPQLQWACILPLSLIAAYQVERKPSIISGFLLSIIIALGFLTAVYYAIFAALLSGSYLICRIVSARTRIFSSRQVFLVALGGIIGLCLLYPFTYPYLAVKDTFGERGIYEAYYFAASLSSYIQAPFISSPYHHLLPHGEEEMSLFPGFLTIALFVTSLIFTTPKSSRRNVLILSCVLMGAGEAAHAYACFPLGRYCTALGGWLLLYYSLREVRNGTPRAEWFALFSFFFFLSLGPLGNPEKGEWPLGLYAALYTFVPGVDGLRAICRSGIVALFCGILFSSFVLAEIPHRLRTILTLFFLVLTTYEQYPQNLPHSPPVRIPALLKDVEVKKLLAGKPLVILPFTNTLGPDKRISSWGDFAQITTTYMQWSSELPALLVNGYSGIRPHILREYPRKLEGFPDERSLRALRTIGGLTYIIYASQHDPLFNKEKLEQFIHQASLTLVKEDSEGTYLLQNNTSVSLSSPLLLFIPPYLRSSITLQLNCNENLPFDIAFSFEQRPLQTQRVSCSNAFASVPLDLPEERDPVRPIQLTLQSRNSGILFRELMWRGLQTQ